MDTIKDLVELDPYMDMKEALFEEFDPTIYFHDIIIDELSFNESVTDNLSNGWNEIKSMTNKMINGVKNLFHRKKKSINDIAAELKLPRNENNQIDELNIDDEAAKSVYNSFIESIKDNKIYINPYKLVYEGDSNAKIKGKKINAAGARAFMVISLMINTNILDEYINIFTRITNGNQNDAVTKSDIDQLVELCEKYMRRPTMGEYIDSTIKMIFNKQSTMINGTQSIYIDIESLFDFQRKVNQLSILNENYDNYMTKLNIKRSINSSNKDEYVRLLNDLSWICVNLQGGLNAISNGLSYVYRVSSEYYASIDDPETLGRFVDALIQTGIPSKYIVNNVYRVCKKSMIGDVNKDKPIMGFGRLTLIPPEGDIVYKVAINGYGVRSNKNDILIMDAIRSANNFYLNNSFAKVSQSYVNNTINSMQKVKAGRKYEPSIFEAKNLANTINRELEKNNIKLKIVDIKPDAFGVNEDGNFVMLDYGYVIRTDIK